MSTGRQGKKTSKIAGMSRLAGNRYSKLPKRGTLQEKLQQIQKEEYHKQARFIV